MGTTASAFTLIRCPACGTPRTVSVRHARRKPKSCRNCNSPVSDLRSFWLSRFTDTEICTMAEAVFELPFGTVDRSLVASARSSTVTNP